MALPSPRRREFIFTQSVPLLSLSFFSVMDQTFTFAALLPSADLWPISPRPTATALLSSHTCTEYFSFHFRVRGYLHSGYLLFLHVPVKGILDRCTEMSLHFTDQCLPKSSPSFLKTNVRLHIYPHLNYRFVNVLAPSKFSAISISSPILRF